MGEQFNKIFWGGILILLDLKFPVDLLPDFLGFYLIYKSLTNLSDNEILSVNVRESFKKGIVPCIVMAWYHFFKWIGVIFIPYTLDNSYASFSFQGVLFIDSLFGVIYIYIIYSILNGIYEYSKEKNLETAKTNQNIWYVFLVSQIVVIISSIMKLNFEIEGYMFFLAIGSLIINVSVFGFIKSIRNKVVD